MFNRSRGTANHLQFGQQIAIRLVATKSRMSWDGCSATMQADGLNELQSFSEAMSITNRVVVSGGVYGNSSAAAKKRMTEHPDQWQGNTAHVLDQNATRIDGVVNLGSEALDAWLSERLGRGADEFEEILYWAYSGDGVAKRIGDYANKLPVRVMLRDWVAERKDEVAYQQRPTASHDAPNVKRLWDKASLIETQSRTMVRWARDNLEIRFHELAPLFRGVILRGKNIDGTERIDEGYIGIYSWLPDPPQGGSPFKAKGWPAVILDGRDTAQADYLAAMVSRFERSWERANTFERVQQRDDEDRDPAREGRSRFWRFERRRPTLVVYPHRKIESKPFPSIAHEDVMAIQGIEKLLDEHGIECTLKSVAALENEPEIREEVEQAVLAQLHCWKGDIVFVCRKVIPKCVWADLESRGFRYYFDESGSKLVDHRTGERASSPIDWEKPEPRDYGLIARYDLDEHRTAFILAGIHAMGTWGATEGAVTGAAFTTIDRAELDASSVATTVEAVFESKTSQLTEVRVHKPLARFGPKEAPVNEAAAGQE